LQQRDGETATTLGKYTRYQAHHDCAASFGVEIEIEFRAQSAAVCIIDV
jgi:hypothetical protein